MQREELVTTMLNFIFGLMMAVLPPCEYEDSANCSWDASTAGNGVGTSFYDIGGTAYYQDGSKA